MPLSNEELERYSRQLCIPGFGEAGQERLRAARVAIVGLGGLGSAVMHYLAGAGVGELGLADTGPVELSNLHRQFAYSSADVGALKTERAAARARALNPAVKVSAREGWLDEGSLPGFLAGYDYVADCSDNFRTRAAVNRACVELGKPCVFGAVYQLEGQVAVFSPGGPCLECLVPGAGGLEDRRSGENGVAGPAVGAVAALQASELVKLIVGLPSLKGRMLILDLEAPGFHLADMKRRGGCPVCGGR